MDDRTTVICQERNGVTLPQSDRWWLDNWPPLHFNCRSSVRALSSQEAITRTGQRGLQRMPTDRAETGFGTAPQPGQEWFPDPNDFQPSIWEILQPRILPDRPGPSTEDIVNP